jgi:hypothetical protein
VKEEDADIVKLDGCRDLKGVPGQAVPAGVQCHLQCKQEQQNNGNNNNKKEEDTKIVTLDGCWDLQQGFQGSCPI